jgi:predicted phosphodiesterase
VVLRQPLRRFGAIGDIHCEDEALAVVLSFMEEAGLDGILAVGDVVDGPGDPDRCCRSLVEHGVVTVRGNHDRWLLAGEMRSLPDATLEVSAESRDFLGALPATRELDTVRGKLLLAHGVGEDDMARLLPDTRGYGLQAVMMGVRFRDDLRFVLGGHTHVPMVRRIGELTFLNAGTLLRDQEPGFLIADFGSGAVELYRIEARNRVTLDRRLPLDPEEP